MIKITTICLLDSLKIYVATPILQLVRIIEIRSKVFQAFKTGTFKRDFTHLSTLKDSVCYTCHVLGELLFLEFCDFVFFCPNPNPYSNHNTNLNPNPFPNSNPNPNPKSLKIVTSPKT